MLKTANNTYIVYEWCNGGNLFDRVAKSKLSEMDRKEVSYCRNKLHATAVTGS